MENFVINYAKKSFGSILGIFTQKKAFFRSEIKNLHREFQKLSTYMKPEGLYLDFAHANRLSFDGTMVLDFFFAMKIIYTNRQPNYNSLMKLL